MSSFEWATNLNHRRGAQEQSISWAMNLAIHPTTAQKQQNCTEMWWLGELELKKKK